MNTTIAFELKGMCPLKMDKYVDGLQPSTDEGYIKQAEEKVYRDEKGNLAVESKAVKASLIASAIELAGIKKGKAMKQTIMAQLFINPLNLTILPERKDHDGIDKVMVARKTGTKVTRVPSYRPIVKEWLIKGEMSAFDVSIDFIKQALDLAGLKYGLLGHRPEFGRFEVTLFKEIK